MQTDEHRPPRRSPPDAVYVVGRSDAETRRLQLQSTLYAPITRRLLESAGIRPGMKVLDVGSGAGDVALMAADMVGDTGIVVGIDTNAAILEIARERARAAGLTHVTFRSGDMREIMLDHDFDAVVGRFVLLFLGDPSAALLYLTQHLRPGGSLAFLELDMTTRTRTVPHAPLNQQVSDWVFETADRAGMEMQMGFKLRQTFINAGLTTPEMHLEAPLGGGPDWPGYDYVAKTLISMFPLMLEYGITTAEQVGNLDTLADRLRDEAVRLNIVRMLTPAIGAWALKPDATTS